MNLDIQKILEQVKNMAGDEGLLAQKEKMEKELLAVQASGISGGGLVEIMLNGKMNLIDITLDPIVLEEKDPIFLQDLIKSAYANAVINVKSKLGREWEQKISGDLLSFLQ